MATLYDLAMQYLKQGLPDISGIYPATTTPPPATTDPVDGGDVQPLLPVMPQPSGGDGYSVYNPDPTRTRTLADYDPYVYRQAAAKSGLGIPSGILSDSSYLYPQKTDIQNLLSQAVNYIPGIGTVKRGLDFLADKLPTNMLPINQRAILENELLGGGIMLDDIGRIVAKDYNTPEGIMAGYNAAMITDKTFDKKRDTIADTLRDKYGMSEAEIAAALAGEYTGPVQTPLINRLSLINQAQKKFQSAQTAKDIITERREAEKSAAASAALESQRRGDRPTAPTGGGVKDTAAREGKSPGQAGVTGGYSYSGGKREGFGYGL